MAATDSAAFVQASANDIREFAAVAEAVHDCGLKLQQTEACIAQLADRVWSIETLLFHTPASQFLHIDAALNEVAAHARVHSGGVSEANIPDDLFATAQDLAEPVADSDDTTSATAERVQRLETLLFRTPISNFVHIDEVISEIVEDARLRERKESNTSAWSPDLSNKFPASLPADDLFTTAKDVADEADYGDIVSIGELSTRMWEDNSVSISGSTGTSATASAIGLPSRLCSSTDCAEVAPRCRSGADRSIRIDELPCAGSETHDIFQDPQWTEESLLLDPTWTEPVPRGLNVVPEEDVLSRAAESGSGSSTGREPSPEEGLAHAALRCSSCSTGRAPSPESQAGSSHDQEKRIAHLIAENAKLQAQLQALVEQGAEQSSASHGNVRAVEQGGDFKSSASSSKEGRGRMLRSREPRAKHKLPRRQRG